MEALYRSYGSHRTYETYEACEVEEGACMRPAGSSIQPGFPAFFKEFRGQVPYAAVQVFQSLIVQEDLHLLSLTQCVGPVPQGMFHQGVPPPYYAGGQAARPAQQ